MFDVLIRNATIVDGTGAPARPGSVAVSGGRIAAGYQSIVDGDVGGLLEIHLREEIKAANPVVSIDGLELKAFDYIDIGAMLEGSGTVPVVIKSLVFPQVA